MNEVKRGWKKGDRIIIRECNESISGRHGKFLRYAINPSQGDDGVMVAVDLDTPDGRPDVWMCMESDIDPEAN